MTAEFDDYDAPEAPSTTTAPPSAHPAPPAAGMGFSSGLSMSALLFDDGDMPLAAPPAGQQPGHPSATPQLSGQKGAAGVQRVGSYGAVTPAALSQGAGGGAAQVKDATAGDAGFMNLHKLPREQRRAAQAELAASLGVPILARTDKEAIIRFSDLYQLSVSVGDGGLGAIQ